MKRALPFRVDRRILVAMICVSMVSSSCFWQRDSYTARLRSEKQRFEREAEYDRVLGPAFEGTAEFPMWIRPPKPTSQRALPKEAEGVLLGLFQGDSGGPLIEFVIIAAVGQETMSEFHQKGFADLGKAGKGPGIELKRQEAATVQCLHGGETLFEVFSGGAARQTGSGPATNYQWVCYFTEEGTQKIMLTFIVPDSNYAAFADPMVKCLESLALSSKVSAARSGTSTGGSSAASGGGTSGGGSSINF